MDWNKLFSDKRLDEDIPTTKSSTRTSYEIDFDRVVFSSAFRRLQDKTQVIPLPESDFVHTRLTHSLETSCVGRSIAKSTGKTIIERYRLKKISVEDFGSAVATACLAHDIGNPPFGHSGENAISKYFKEGNGIKYKKHLKPGEWSDLTNFEGNANGFRILTNMNNISRGNIMLTYTTLASFIKYPCGSLKGKSKYIPGIHKKYGYFQSEKENFIRIFDELGIIRISPGVYARHPLAYIVESADDICYRIIDFEDGIRIGLVPFEQAIEILTGILPSGQYRKTKYQNILDRKEKIGYLRSKVISFLVKKVTEIFLDKETKILEGKFSKSLLEELDSDTIKNLNTIEKLSVENIYNSRPVVMIEISGFNVVGKLLDLFINSVNSYHTLGDKIRDKDIMNKKILDLLPKQYLGNIGYPENDLYIRLLQICEFVAGMTDTYAISLYKKLTGIEISN